MRRLFEIKSSRFSGQNQCVNVAVLSLLAFVLTGQAIAGSAKPDSLVIQLGAFRDQKVADRVRQDVLARHGGILGEVDLRLVADTAKRASLTRLLAGPFTDRDAAARLCRTLQSGGTDCFVTRSAGTFVERQPPPTANAAKPKLVELAPATEPPAQKPDPSTVRGNNVVAVYQAGLLTVDADYALRRDVVQAAAQAAGIKVLINGVVDDRLTLSFVRRPLIQGLGQLLGDYNWYLVDADRTGDRPRVLFVNGAGESGRTRRLVTTESVHDLEVKLAVAADTQTKRDAIRTLAQIGTDRARHVLAQAASDKDPTIAQAAANALAGLPKN